MSDLVYVSDVDKARKPEEFQKDDEGKTQWSKFPWRGAKQVMTIMEFGANKYGWDNWRKAKTPKERQRFLEAAFRHLIADARGDHIDQDSQEMAIAHAACTLLFWLERAGEYEQPVVPNKGV